MNLKEAHYVLNLTYVLVSKILRSKPLFCFIKHGLYTYEMLYAIPNLIPLLKFTTKWDALEIKAGKCILPLRYLPRICRRTKKSPSYSRMNTNLSSGYRLQDFKAT